MQPTLPQKRVALQSRVETHATSPYFAAGKGPFSKKRVALLRPRQRHQDFRDFRRKAFGSIGAIPSFANLCNDISRKVTRRVPSILFDRCNLAHQGAVYFCKASLFKRWSMQVVELGVVRDMSLEKKKTQNCHPKVRELSLYIYSTVILRFFFGEPSHENLVAYFRRGAIKFIRGFSREACEMVFIY